MYPSILSFKTINKLKLFFECGIPRPQNVGHLPLRYCNFLTHLIISIAVLENVPPDAGLHKRTTFSTLNIGLAGTGNLPGPPAWQAAALTAQPSTSPLTPLLLLVQILNPSIISITVLDNVPRVTENNHLFQPNRRSGCWNRGSSSGQLHGR
jgi:hypothetical protein